MKTLTIISALSLALIFTGINTSFAKQNDKSGANKTMIVRYQVKINVEIMRTLCNNYQVEVLDAGGRPVAPPQLYVPGNDVYSFQEQTRQAAGIRIARLVLIIYGPEHYVCDQELFTSPDVRLLNFQDGMVVTFNLYPRSEPTKKGF